MKINLIALLLMMVVNVGVDYYIYHVASRRVGRRWLTITAIAAIVVGWVLLGGILAVPTRGASDGAFVALMWLMLGYFSVYAPKYIFTFFDLLAKIPQLIGRRRLRPLTFVGAGLGIVSFLLMWWGALINRFRVDVERVTVEIADLPEAFDGFTIAQFSDLHTGTYYHDPSFVDKFVGAVNSLDADMIVFTGDIVNRHTEELIPFVESLSKLSAPAGQYAILGNHDYGDYYKWDNESDKQKSLKLLRDLYKKTSLDLLTDDTRMIYRGGDSIALVGVENIGRPPFNTYGSLTRAYPDVSDGVVKVLLSHDPSHWLDSIADNHAANVALTLSGHTHAMQVKLGRLSPAALHHEAWAGLYKDKSGEHQLYVNIGAGEVGPPMRIGATPEITLITLRRK